MGGSVEWIRHIAQVQADQGGISGLCRLLTERIRRTVFVTDGRGRILVWHVSPQTPMYREEKIYIPASVLKAKEAVDGILTLDGQRIPYHCWPIIHKEPLGYLWVLPDQEPLPVKLTEEVECVRAAMLVELIQRRHQRGIEQRLQDELIHNILFNNAASIETLDQVWGWNLGREYVVMALENNLAVPGQGAAEIRNRIEEVLSGAYPGLVMGMIGDVYVLLVPIERQFSEKKQQTPRLWKNMAEEVFGRLQKALSDVNLHAGAGNVYWDSPSLHRSYQEAKVALQLGSFLKKGSGLTFFHELGAMRLFYNQREQDLKDYFTEVLGPVQMYDQESEGSLLQTLLTYYIAEGNIADTTAKMHIHVNTLRYRLRKVEELLSVKLDDQEVRFNIYAALKVGIMLGLL